jgi:hypothetical protein
MPEPLHAAGNYFATPAGKAIYLAGSHTWNEAQQIGPTAFTFEQFLDFEQAIGGNFIRYWNFTTSTDAVGTIPDRDLPWVRSSTPGANDGAARWDLTRFNETYFENLRSNIIAAGRRHMYVSFMLFAAETNYPASAAGEVFLAENNVNGVDAGSASGEERLGNAALLAMEEAYVARVIDAIGDLPNVLYEVTNEADNTTDAYDWQEEIARFLRWYERHKGIPHHPVGITSPYPVGDPNINATLFQRASSDWTSPYGWRDYQGNPPDAPGNKPVIVDTDHTGGAGKDAGWVWQMFTRGYNVAYMDNMCGSGLPDTVLGNNDGDCALRVSARLGINTTSRAARLLNLRYMLPHGDLSSTGYVLANPAGGEYAIYAPNGGEFEVDLSGSVGQLGMWWVDVDGGTITAAGTVQAGGARRFSAPHARDALLLTP